MSSPAHHAHAIVAPCLLGVGAALVGCAGGGALTGERIMRDLERSRIVAPTEEGTARSPEPAPELPGEGPIGLADLLRVAEARSPALAAARSEVGVAAGRAWQASLYPNPRLDAGVEDVSFDDSFSGAKTTVGLTQPIILGDRRRAAMDAADAEQAARLAEAEAIRREIFGEIADVHARLLAIRQQMVLYRELHELASQTAEAGRTRFEARAVPETDMIRPRVEAYRIEANLGRLARSEEALQRRLELLLGDVEVDVARLEGQISMAPDDLDPDDLEARIRAAHPSLLAADRQIEAAEARLASVRAENVPDLDVRVAGGYRNDADDAIIEFGAGMALPLWDRREGDVLSARFQLMSARQRRAAAEIDLLERLTEAIGRYASAKAELDTFRDQIVPDAERAFALTGEAYRAGRSSFMDLLDAQRTMTEARVALSELAGDATTARARIMQIVGPEKLAPASGVAPAPLARALSTTQMRPTGAEASP